MEPIPFNRQDIKKIEWAQANLDEFCDRPTQEQLRHQYKLRGLVPTGNLAARITSMYEHQQIVPPTGEYDPKDHLGQDILKTSLERNPARLRTILELCQQNRALQNKYAQLRFGRSNEEQQMAQRLAPEVDEINWQLEQPLNEVFWEVAPKLEEAGIQPAKFCIKSGPGDTLDSVFDDQSLNDSSILRKKSNN